MHPSLVGKDARSIGAQSTGVQVGFCAAKGPLGDGEHAGSPGGSNAAQLVGGVQIGDQLGSWWI